MKNLLSVLIAVTLISSSCFITFAKESKSLTINTQTEYKYEIDEYGLGALVDEDELDETTTHYNKNSVETNELINSRNLPASVDLSSDNAFPCIRSQGAAASCTTWASTYYQFGFQVAKLAGCNAKNDDSKQFSPKSVFNQVNGGSNTGSFFKSNYEILKHRGAIKFDEFPPHETPVSNTEYTEWCTDTDYQKEALIYRLSDYNSNIITSDNSNPNTPITNLNSTSLLIMKNLLNTNHVLTFITHYGKQEHNNNPVYTNGNTNLDWIYDELSNGEKVCIAGKNVSSGATPNKYNHSLSIVGYDDTIWYDYDEDGIQDDYEMGAFKIANSHGTGYGNDGFMWVMYDALNITSNCTTYNQDRFPILVNCKYYYIEIKQSNRDLLAEITISQTERNQHTFTLSSLDSNNTENSTIFLRNRGGRYRYDGTQSSVQQSTTFVIDYDVLISENREWLNYQIGLFDLNSTPQSFISEINFVDRTGKTVVSDTINDYIINRTAEFNYFIGMVGDVNNDSSVDILDVTKIQNYLSGATTLTDNQEIVADVDGDGSITNTDVSFITQYCVDIITEFDNGAFVLLNS